MSIASLQQTQGTQTVYGANKANSNQAVKNETKNTAFEVVDENEMMEIGDNATEVAQDNPEESFSLTAFLIGTVGAFLYRQLSCEQ